MTAPDGAVMSTICARPFSFTTSKREPAPTGEPLNGPTTRSFHWALPVFVSAAVITPAPLMLNRRPSRTSGLMVLGLICFERQSSVGGVLLALGNSATTPLP